MKCQIVFIWNVKKGSKFEIENSYVKIDKLHKLQQVVTKLLNAK